MAGIEQADTLHERHRTNRCTSIIHTTSSRTNKLCKATTQNIQLPDAASTSTTILPTKKNFYACATPACLPYLLLAVTLAVASLRAVSLLRRPLLRVPASRRRLGGLARRGGLPLAVAALLVVAASVRLVLLPVPTAAVAALLVVAVSIALLSAVPVALNSQQKRHVTQCCSRDLPAILFLDRERPRTR